MAMSIPRTFSAGTSQEGFTSPSVKLAAFCSEIGTPWAAISNICPGVTAKFGFVRCHSLLHLQLATTV